MPTPLSILNLNCWLFPPPLSSDCEARLTNIIKIINEHGPDIITLQEIWSNKHLRYLKDELSDYTALSSGSMIYNRSGLVTFTKPRPASSKIGFFKLSIKHNPTEWFLHRGYIKVDLKLNNHDFSIINTHLYAPFSTRAKAITEHQFEELIKNIPSSGSVLISGDLNIDEQKFAKMNQDKFLRLCDSQPPSDAKNPYSYGRFNRLMSHENKKIDYMLFRGKILPKSEYQLIQAPFVSDHYPMFCRLNFEF